MYEDSVTEKLSWFIRHMSDQTYVRWALYSIPNCDISHQTFGPSHQKCLTCPMIFVNTAGHGQHHPNLRNGYRWMELSPGWAWGWQTHRHTRTPTHTDEQTDAGNNIQRSKLAMGNKTICTAENFNPNPFTRVKSLVLGVEATTLELKLTVPCLYFNSLLLVAEVWERYCTIAFSIAQAYRK